MTWSGIPGALIPGQEYSVSMSAKITQNVWPKGQRQLRLGSGMSLNHTRRSQDAIESLPTQSNAYSYLGGVTASLPDKYVDSATAKFTPPAYSIGKTEYAIKASILNVQMNIAYIFKWEQGLPSEEETKSIIPVPKPRPKLKRGEAIISMARGDIEVDEKGFPGMYWQKAKPGMILRPGVSIRTRNNDDSRGEIVFADGSVMRLCPNTWVTIPQPKDKSDEKITLLRLIGGRLWKNVTGGSDVEIETSSAIAGVRGTTYSIEVRENGSEQFNCYTGEVYVKPHETGDGPVKTLREVTIKAGQTTGFSPRGQMIGIGKLTDEEMAIGLVMTSANLFENEVSPEEKQGERIFEAEKDDWRLKIYKQNNNRHGILIYDGLVVREVAKDQFTSPFSILRYYGEYNASQDSGWLLDETVDAAIPVSRGDDRTVAAHSNEHVTLDKASFASNEEIRVTWHGLPGGTGTQGDWITIIPANAPENTWGKWWYTGGQQSGSHNAGVFTPGEYEVRVYFDWPRAGYVVQSRLAITVR
jgi:hypothetical protein